LIISFETNGPLRKTHKAYMETPKRNYVQ
jgi:hypothetical protein